MTAKRVQGPAEPVYLVDGETGELVGREKPLLVQLAEDADLETSIEGTVSTAGNNEVGPTPAANERICITAFTLQNESGVLTTIILKDGVAPAAGRWRVHTQNRGDGLALVFDLQHPLRLTPGNRITLHLSAAQQCGYSFQFYRED